jgi:chromosome segregation ATPase
VPATPCENGGLRLEKIRNLEEKISTVIEKARQLRKEKDDSLRRVEELEGLMALKDQEIASLKRDLEMKNADLDRLLGEKNSVTEQIETILGELDHLEI